MIISKSKPRIIIIGGKYLGCAVMEYLHANNVNICLVISRADDEGKDTLFPSIKKLSKSYKIKCINPLELKSLSILKKYKPDLILSIENNRIIPSSWINYMKNKIGIINSHFSPLPAYAGYWPEMWSIWNDEKIFGVTLHHISKDIDQGNIIDQKIFKINKNETRQSLYIKSYKNCFQLFKKNLNKIINEEKIINTNDYKFKSSFYKRNLPNNGFIDKKWSLKKQERFIRSLSYPGYSGPKIKIGKMTYTILEDDIEFYKKIEVKYI